MLGNFSQTYDLCGSIRKYEYIDFVNVEQPDIVGDRLITIKKRNTHYRNYELNNSLFHEYFQLPL